MQVKLSCCLRSHTRRGDTFNVRTEEIAARAAPALLASKLIFVTAGHEFAWKDINIPPESTSRRVASLQTR